MTTFISFLPPTRMHGDTVRVELDEEGLNPAACRKSGGFAGGSDFGYILVQEDGYWHVAGRSAGNYLSWSGHCGKE